MARAIWKGHISFGLVQIPVSLYTAVERDDLSFTMLDQRNMAKVGYERVNKETGEPVPWEEVVKGFAVDKDEYVVLTDEDFAAANVEATQTIDILKFVDAGAIDPMYYEKPYYLEPTKKGQKAYALLRETLRESGMVGIAKVVIRRREHLAAATVRGDAIVLEILRFAHELRGMEELELPESGKKKLEVTQAELKMAQQLVSGMAGEWDPNEFHDEYREDLLALIDRKVKAGDVNVVSPPEAYEEAEPRAPRGVDLMSLLKDSIAEQGSTRRKSTRDTTKRAARTAKAKAKATKQKTSRKKKR